MSPMKATRALKRQGKSLQDKPISHSTQQEVKLDSLIKNFRDEITALEYVDHIEDKKLLVCVRKRPSIPAVDRDGDVDAITASNQSQVTVHDLKKNIIQNKRPILDNQSFAVDYVFDGSCDNEFVYRYTARPLVKHALQGGTSTCFVFGETGSGKSHTMLGDLHENRRKLENGVFAMTGKEILQLVESIHYCDNKFTVACSFYEICKEKVFDLLGQRNVFLLENDKNEFKIPGLTEKSVETFEDLLKLIQLGNNNKTYGRASHAVFQIVLQYNNNSHGRFVLIDLAGNKKASSSNQTDSNEAADNVSYFAIKECIQALSRRDNYIPFRRTKITKVLRDSFIGEESRMCMIATLCPGLSSRRHSLTTLRISQNLYNIGTTWVVKKPGVLGESTTETEVTYTWRKILSICLRVSMAICLFGTLFIFVNDDDDDE